MAKLTAKTKPKPKTEPKAKSTGLSPVCYSDQMTLMRWIIVIHGPRGAGKTWLAATASKDFPKTVPVPKMITLSDMFWIAADAGATDGFAEAGMRVKCVDLYMLMTTEEMWRAAGFRMAPTIVQAMEFAARQAATETQRNNNTIVVVDTASALNRMLQTHAETLPDIAGSTNKYKKWDWMFSANRKFHGILKSNCRKILYLTHSKATLIDSDAQKRKSLATRSPGLPDIVPNIPGQSADMYIDDSSLELLVLAKEVAGKKGSLKRTVYPVKHQGFEAKNRFELSLDAEEEPNLGKIFAKIAKKARR